MMKRLWRWYERSMRRHPVRTEVVTSGVLWALADVAAQTVTHFSSPAGSPPPASSKDKGLRIDWKRVFITSIYGFVFVGIVGHYWYVFLDQLIRHSFHLHPKSLEFVVTKVVVDGLIFGPVDYFLFFVYIGLASGRSISQVKDDVRRDFLPAFILGGVAWPLVQVLNFWFVPVRYQLLYVNLFCLLDGCFLSWFEQQGDAPWKRFLSWIERRWFPAASGSPSPRTEEELKLCAAAEQV